MKLNELHLPQGSRHAIKRVGRGESSGVGKTSGRGHKGQKARAGGYHKTGFEGGQMPLQRRLPKRGFVNISRKEFEVVNVSALSRFEPGSEIDHAKLKAVGLIKKRYSLVKVLGDGVVSVALTVKLDQFSRAAAEKIEKAGGKAVTLTGGLSK